MSLHQGYQKGSLYNREFTGKISVFKRDPIKATPCPQYDKCLLYVIKSYSLSSREERKERTLHDTPPCLY